MMIEQERIGKTGFAESAVNFHRDDSLAIALRYVNDIKSDIELEDFTFAPFFNRSGAAELPSDVGHEGTVAEAGEKCVGVMLIDRSNEPGYGLRHCYFLFHSVLNSFAVRGTAKIKRLVGSG